MERIENIFKTLDIIRPAGAAAPNNSTVAEGNQVEIEKTLIEERFGVYSGPVVAGKPHGHGVWTGRLWEAGNSYVGEWSDGQRHGRGTIWLQRHGGVRCFDGVWSRDGPLSGTAVERDGSFRHAAFDRGGSYLCTWLSHAQWAPAPAAGRIESWPQPEGAAGGPGGPPEWAGAVVMADGSRFEGRLRGLRPLDGELVGPDGRRGPAACGGDRTLAEDPFAGRVAAR